MEISTRPVSLQSGNPSRWLPLQRNVDIAVSTVSAAAECPTSLFCFCQMNLNCVAAMKATCFSRNNSKLLFALTTFQWLRGNDLMELRWHQSSTKNGVFLSTVRCRTGRCILSIPFDGQFARRLKTKSNAKLMSKWAYPFRWTTKCLRPSGKLIINVSHVVVWFASASAGGQIEA